MPRYEVAELAAEYLRNPTAAAEDFIRVLAAYFMPYPTFAMNLTYCGLDFEEANRRFGFPIQHEARMAAGTFRQAVEYCCLDKPELFGLIDRTLLEFLEFITPGESPSGGMPEMLGPRLNSLEDSYMHFKDRVAFELLRGKTQKPEVADFHTTKFNDGPPAEFGKDNSVHELPNCWSESVKAKAKRLGENPETIGNELRLILREVGKLYFLHPPDLQDWDIDLKYRGFDSWYEPFSATSQAALDCVADWVSRFQRAVRVVSTTRANASLTSHIDLQWLADLARCLTLGWTPNVGNELLLTVEGLQKQLEAFTNAVDVVEQPAGNVIESEPLPKAVDSESNGIQQLPGEIGTAIADKATTTPQIVARNPPPAKVIEDSTPTSTHGITLTESTNRIAELAVAYVRSPTEAVQDFRRILEEFDEVFTTVATGKEIMDCGITHQLATNADLSDVESLANGVDVFCRAVKLANKQRPDLFALVGVQALEDWSTFICTVGIGVVNRLPTDSLDDYGFLVGPTWRVKSNYRDFSEAVHFGVLLGKPFTPTKAGNADAVAVEFEPQDVTGQPADNVTEAKPLPDGPDESDLVFRWKGRTVDGFTGTGFDLLKAMWEMLNNEQHRISRADLVAFLPDRMVTWNPDPELKNFSKYQTEVRRAFDAAKLPRLWEYNQRTKRYEKHAIYRE